MEIQKIINSERKKIILEGIYECQIIAVVESEWLVKHEKKRGFKIYFMVSESLTQKDTPYKGQIIARQATPTISPRSFLSKIIRAAIGRELTYEELAKVNNVEDMKQMLVGRPVVVVIENFYSFLYRDLYYVASFFARSKYFDDGLNEKNNIIPLIDTVSPTILSELESTSPGTKNLEDVHNEHEEPVEVPTS